MQKLCCVRTRQHLCQFGLFRHNFTTVSPPILNHFWWELYQYTPKVCKNQVVTAGCLLTVLDMRPSTTNNPTRNNDPKFTASPNSTLVSDHTRSQTNLSRSQTSPDSRWHQYGLVAYPSYLTGSSCINYDLK